MHIVTSIYNDFSYQPLVKFSRNNLYKRSKNKVVNYKHKLIVYQKIDQFDKDQYIKYEKDKVEIRELRNYGRCDYAFLKFIIDEYENLPEKILFTKANFFHQNIKIEHSEKDFKFNLIGKDLKYVIMDQNFDVKDLKNIPQNSIEDVRNNYKEKYLLENENDYSNPMIMDFYKIVFKDFPKPKNYYKAFGHGPCFTVTKNLILRHPKKVYLDLIDLFENSDHWDNKDVISDLSHRYHNHFLRFWSILFTHGLDLEIETDNINYIGYK